MARTASPTVAWPVIITTSVAGARAFTAARSSKPSAPGMRMSVTTTSYGRVATRASARAPSGAVSTS